MYFIEQCAQLHIKPVRLDTTRTTFAPLGDRVGAETNSLRIVPCAQATATEQTRIAVGGTEGEAGTDVMAEDKRRGVSRRNDAPLARAEQASPAESRHSGAIAKEGTAQNRYNIMQKHI